MHIIVHNCLVVVLFVVYERAERRWIQLEPGLELNAIDKDTGSTGDDLEANLLSIFQRLGGFDFWLKPDSLDPILVSLLKDGFCDRRRGDDGDMVFCGRAGQRGKVRDAGNRLDCLFVGVHGDCCVAMVDVPVGDAGKEREW